MRNRLILVSMVLCLASPIPLEAKKKISMDITPFIGYRQDDVKWKTRSGTLPSGVTQPASTLQWKNLQGIQYGLKTETTLRDRYKLNLDLGFANLLNGTMTDSNYLAAAGSGNPAQNSINGKGFAFRPNIAFGFNLKPRKSIDLIPQIGFVYDHLKLRGSGNALNSLSNTLQFSSPYIGIDSKARFNRRWSMTASAAFNLAFYQGTGHWTFKQNQTNNAMKQGGNGLGLKGQIGLKYMIVPSVSVGGEADINWNRVNNGHDTRHFANGARLRTRLNNLNWTSFAGRVTLTKSF